MELCGQESQLQVDSLYYFNRFLCESATWKILWKLPWNFVDTIIDVRAEVPGLGWTHSARIVFTSSPDRVAPTFLSSQRRSTGMHGRLHLKNLGGGQNSQISCSLLIFVQWPDRQKGTKYRSMNKWHQQQFLDKLLLLWSVMLTANCLRYHVITACDSISGWSSLTLGHNSQLRTG